MDVLSGRENDVKNMCRLVDECYLDSSNMKIVAPLRKREIIGFSVATEWAFGSVIVHY